MSRNKYDIIIIGTGAGGATMLHALADTGKRILVLERGDFLPKEKENWDSEEVFVKGRYKTTEKWLDVSNREFTPDQHYWVGGNTKMYGATLLRFREKDFNELKHVDGISEAWPVKYRDFEPYYKLAEELFYVHGKAGIDPTEPKRSSEFPYPAIDHEPRIDKLYSDLKSAGLRPFPLPTAVKLWQDNPTIKGKSVLDRFDGYPDASESKADAQVIGVNPNIGKPNVTLLTNCYVTKLITSKNGRRVERVIVQKDGQNTEYTAALIIVSCGAINSAALFLRSASSKHPDGLGNSSGLVGRNLMLHNNSVFIALSRTLNNSKFGKTIGINDFYFANQENKYPLGHIQMLGKLDATAIRGDVPFITPNFIVKRIAAHTIDFWLTSEDLALPENRVILSESGQIKIEYKPTNLSSHKLLIKNLAGILGHIGCIGNVYKTHKMGIAKIAHQCGTMRFGNDPKTSVLDVNCKSHDLDNVYVVDASFFVSSASVNPALTIIANSLRIADHLKKNVIKN